MVLAGCGDQGTSYTLDTPEDTLDSAKRMVETGEAQRLVELIYAETPEQRSLLGQAGRLLGALQDLGDIVQGSPLYLPPERLTCDGEDPTSEVFSLGMVLFHMLMGRPYFDKNDVLAVSRLHVGTLRVSHRDRELREKYPGLAEVVLKMIARQPEERPRSFCEAESLLLEALGHFIYPNVSA